MPGSRPPMMFGHVVHALLSEGFPQPLSKQCLRRLQQLGVDPMLPRPAYPIEVWVNALEVLREEVLTELATSEAYRELGRRVVNVFVRTKMGRAVAASTRLAGPERMLSSLSWVLRSASNFMDTTVERLGPRRYRVTLNTRVLEPGYNEGVLAEMLSQAGAEGVAVARGRWTETGRLSLELHWER